MCDKLSQSVTLPAIAFRETGNTETLGDGFSAESQAHEVREAPETGTIRKLAQLLQSLTHNKNNNGLAPIKTTRIGSDITRTTRTETQLTDFFGVDRFT